MGDFKINEKTVFTQSGSAEPAMGSTVTGIPAAGVTGVLPVGVTGGSGLTALGTVTAGVLNSGVTGGSGLSNGIDGGQTWQDVLSSRAYNTTYTNSTGKPIQLCINGIGNTAGVSALRIYADGTDSTGKLITSCPGNITDGLYRTMASGISVIIPNGGTYYAFNNSTFTLVSWFELR